MKAPLMRGIAVTLLFLVVGCGTSGGSSASPTDPYPPTTSSGPTIQPPSAPPAPVPETSSDTPAEPDSGPRTPLAGQVPQELVGEWDGDGQGSARATKIEFFAEGYVAVHYNNGQVLRGPAVVDGSAMTLHIPGGPLYVRDWSITPFDAGYGYAFENLLLDGVSYVRQISGG
ncbi:hypothetical protein TUSST3_55810 [Streptomyces sp. TUS-ST3]|jgi:hypothetical protein|uniref:hypothetical protein n=1 Tax=unclassified Streptomyces TaxID=2593676 RepID=UPI001BAF5E22|nr:MULTISPECIES: hypothetical protein [unclassified Streptomyces]QUC58887.1 hypothetical protein IOD14_19965 [Streptomyces sp. A2-16]GLP68958.1 hypothetical protein TUSST3_55810 [Streptomyces sp. TUS-ST3]